MRQAKRRGRKSFLGPIIWTITIGFGLLLAFLFIGLPLLAKLSLFLTEIKGKENLIVTDQIPPFPPQLEVPYSATNSAQITLSGTAEANSTVTLYLNDQPLKEILVGKDGTFTKRVTLDDEENKITAIATDQAGNKSSFSAVTTIFYKKKLPLLEIESPRDEKLEVNKKELEIKGRTDPEVSLTINQRLVLVENDGSFSHLITLSTGENLIEIMAVDQAGNQTKAERKIIYTPQENGN